MDSFGLGQGFNVKRVMPGYIPDTGIFRSPVTISLPRSLFLDFEVKENIDL